MNKSRTAGGRIWFLCGFLGTYLVLFCSASADGVIKEVSDPTGNVNLSPFAQWRSAYECLLNTSDSCSDKYQLTEGGWINVTRVDTGSYCTGGCSEHTQAVLMCIHLVKQDFKFVNTASVQDLNQTIINGCEHGGFTGITLISSAAKIYEIRSAIFLCVLASLLLTYFKM